MLDAVGAVELVEDGGLGYCLGGGGEVIVVGVVIIDITTTILLRGNLIETNGILIAIE